MRCAFGNLLSKLRNNIWLILPVDNDSLAYFDNTTLTIENLSQGDSIFDVHFNTYDHPVYLKVRVNADEVATYQFKTPNTLRNEANKMKGTAELSSILQKIVADTSIDSSYLSHYVKSYDNDSYHYFSHVGGTNFYLEFTDLTPFTLMVETPKSNYEVLITPFYSGQTIDYSAKLSN